MRLFFIFLLSISTLSGISQTERMQFVASGGIGASLGMTSLKTGLNIGLKEIGLEKATGSLIINGNLDVGITEKFSLGFAYTTNQFNWRDDFYRPGPNDTLDITPDSIVANAAVKIKRQNFAIRGLYHFALGEKHHDLYLGGRVGFTLWQTSIAGDVQGTPLSGFSFPASLPSIQVLVGYRHYVTSFMAINGELGVGSAPYFAGIGLSFAIPGNTSSSGRDRIPNWRD